jgi:16S rRNA C967 or C1407 C5-methylase (RsmB/RsmF family)
MVKATSATNAKLSKKFVAYVRSHPEQYGDADAFLSALDQWPVKAARANTHVFSAAQLCNQLEIKFDPVPWCPDATYFDFESKIGQREEHSQGLFYIGDASAMAVVELAAIKASDVVVDMCAAPGGKSIHAINFLGSEGHLISNDIDTRRIKTLQENINRILKPIDEKQRPRVEVANLDGEALVKQYEATADVVILDAPCSGEAMMRRSDVARRQWSEKLIRKMSEMQKELLEQATRIIKPGGRIIYSTCTFNEVENENVIASCECEIRTTETLRPHQMRGDGQRLFVLAAK